MPGKKRKGKTGDQIFLGHVKTRIDSDRIRKPTEKQVKKAGEKEVARRKRMTGKTRSQLISSAVQAGKPSSHRKILSRALHQSESRKKRRTGK